MDKKRSFGVRAMESFLRLHARLPLAYHYAWGRFITWLVRDVFRYRNDVVLTNVARSFPDKDYDAIKDIYQQFYVHFGELFAEAVWFSRAGKSSSGRTSARSTTSTSSTPSTTVPRP